MKTTSNTRRPSYHESKRAQRQLRRLIEAGVPMKTLAYESSMSERILRNVSTNRTFRPRANHFPSTINLLFTEVFHDLIRADKNRTSPDEHKVQALTNTPPEQECLVPQLGGLDSDTQASQETHPSTESSDVCDSESGISIIQDPVDGGHLPILRYELYQHLQDKLIGHMDLYMERFRELGTQVTEARIETHEHIYNLTFDLCDEVSLRKSEHYRSEFMDLKTKYPDTSSAYIADSEATAILFIGVTKDQRLQEAETHLLANIQGERDYFLTRCAEEENMMTESIALSAQTIKDEIYKRSTREEILSIADELKAELDEDLNSMASSTFVKALATERHKTAKDCSANIHGSFTFPELDRVLRRLKCGKGAIESELSQQAVWSLMLGVAPTADSVKKRCKDRR